MTWFFFNEVIWETFSLLAITAYLIFHFIHYVSTKKYVMFKLLWVLTLIVIALMIAIKARQVAPHYKIEGAVDIILGTAMAMITFDFIILFARACGMRVTASLESICFWIIALVYLGAGAIFLASGTPEQFARYDQLIDMLLQPFWIVVLIRLIFLTRGPNKPVHTL